MSEPVTTRAARPRSRAAAPNAGGSRPRRVGRPPAGAEPDSRRKLLAAAGHEFAERGYAGASVDRIARRARVNKAMIYYHFGSKLRLYREVLRDLFREVGQRVWTLPTEAASPHEALEAFVAGIVQEAEGRPYFPRMVLRELADRARHIDADTLTLAVSLPQTLGRIIARGVEAGAFRPVNPALAYATIIGSVVAFFGSAPMRARLPPGPLRVLADLDASDLTTHCQRTLRAIVELSPGEAAVRTTEDHA